MLEKNGMDNSGGSGVHLRLKTVAARLGVSVRTVYRIVAEGGLKLDHFRGCARIAEDNLLNYIERRTQGRKA